MRVLSATKDTPPVTRPLRHLPDEQQTSRSLVVCDHLQDTTSRYDPAEKVLTFIRVCRICGIEQVVETLDYEPKPVGTGRGAEPRLAVLPAETSIPPDATLTEWPHRRLAA
jgi:hypothetical protein